MNAKQELAEVDRLAVESRINAPLAGPAPEVADIVSASDRRVYANKLVPGAVLSVKVYDTLIPDNTDKVSVQIRKTGSTTWQDAHTFDAGPVAGRPTSWDITIRSDLLTEDNPPVTPTTWELRCRIQPQPVGNPNNSDTATIIIDRRAPYQALPGGLKRNPPVAALPTLSPGDLIDEAFIVRHSPNAVITVTHTYENPLPDDVLRFYISRIYSLTNPDVPIYEGPASASLSISINKFRLLDPLAVYAYYTVADGAGNISALSRAQGVHVRFAPLPVLEEPIVELAETDKLIDLVDSASTTVKFKRVDNILDSDEVRVEWGGQNLGEFPFGTSNPLVVPVPFDDIFNEYYDPDPDIRTDKEVTIKATLLRGTGDIGTSDLDINVNIYYPGPINPTDPTPPNAELEAPHITSTTVEDVLEPGDYENDQTVTFDLWTTPAVESGQQIFGEYQGVRFGPEFLKDGQTTVTMTLPWPTIDAGGVGTDRKLQYFVSEIGGVNENPSLITNVTNNAIVVDLDEPKVLQEDAATIYCDDLKEPGFGLKVRIPGNTTHLLDGRNVYLYAQGYRDSAMTQISPDTDFKSAVHLIDGGEGATGFDMVISPYDTFIRNIPVPPPAPIPSPPGDYRGWWKIWYTVEINTVEYPSVEFESAIYLINGYGEYCEDQ
ncbi:hypothetical protein [Pseudomonas sp. NPDC087639]|uniref:hypothetical protein n=1 Tax=Pseudomonas sp. NPDC087639 TaxID=3364445 RepID=UPI0038046F59